MRILLGVIIAAAVVGCHSDSQTAATKPSDDSSGTHGNKVVLFDGKNADSWQHEDGSPCKWKVEDGILTAGGGDIFTKEKFSHCHVHVEFMTPKFPPEVKGQ